MRSSRTQFRKLLALVCTATVLGGLGVAALTDSPLRAECQKDQEGTGKEGDFVGVWKKVDVQTRRVVGIVEFRQNGDSEETDPSGKRARIRQYQFKDPTLEFTNIVGHGGGNLPDQVIVLEWGKVDWVNGTLFKYQQEAGGGFQFQGRTYEFFRQSGSEGKRDVANLIGTWKWIDLKPDLPGRPTDRTVILKTDGTYKDTNRPESWHSRDPRYGEYRFHYKNCILAFVGGQVTYARGRVDWITQDKFQFMAFYGIDTEDGKVSEFQRVERESLPATPTDDDPQPQGQLGVGKEGDFIGVWEGVDVKTRRPATVVEFQANGACQTTGEVVATQYQFNDPILSFTFINPRTTPTNRKGQVVVVLEGTVEWISGSLFKYKVATVRQGYHGEERWEREYEFFRQSGLEDEKEVADIVGRWDGTPTRRIELNRDGTFREENQFGGSGRGQGNYRYKYKDRILSLVRIDANFQEWLLERGRVDWINQDKFRFKVLDGSKTGNKEGEVYEFVRTGNTR